MTYIKSKLLSLNCIYHPVYWRKVHCRVAINLIHFSLKRYLCGRNEVGYQILLDLDFLYNKSHFSFYNVLKPFIMYVMKSLFLTKKTGSSLLRCNLFSCNTLQITKFFSCYDILTANLLIDDQLPNFCFF